MPDPNPVFAKLVSVKFVGTFLFWKKEIRINELASFSHILIKFLFQYFKTFLLPDS